jgi:hypothetical protein
VNPSSNEFMLFKKYNDLKPIALKFALNGSVSFSRSAQLMYGSISMMSKEAISKISLKKL